MKVNPARRAAQAVPLLASIALVLSACGGDNDNATAAQEAAPVAAAPSTTDAMAPEAVAQAPVEKAAKADTKTKAAPNTKAAATDTAAGAVAPKAESASKATQAKAKSNAAAPAALVKSTGPKAKAGSGEALTKIVGGETAEQKQANQKIYEDKNGATEIGVTKDGIKLGSVNMHGMALGNIITLPQVRANLASAAAINDRGGVLGRRLSIVDCDDGPGEVSRAKACIKKLAGQDKIFALVTGIDWATASSTTTSRNSSCLTSVRGRTASPSGRTRTCSPLTCR